MKKGIFVVFIICALLALMCGFTSVERLRDEQNIAHEAAELIRDLGYAEDHPLITMLQDRWWENESEIKKLENSRTYTDEDVEMIAKVVAAEAGGLGTTEQSAVIWCILNRCDNWGRTIESVITEQNQFAYFENATVREDIEWLARDVLDRWTAEKIGETDVGRTLGKEYMWFYGDGEHNYFRDAYRGGNTWEWELISPY